VDALLVERCVSERRGRLPSGPFVIGLQHDEVAVTVEREPELFRYHFRKGRWEKPLAEKRASWDSVKLTLSFAEIEEKAGPSDSVKLREVCPRRVRNAFQRMLLAILTNVKEFAFGAIFCLLALAALDWLCGL